MTRHQPRRTGPVGRASAPVPDLSAMRRVGAGDDPMLPLRVAVAVLPSLWSQLLAKTLAAEQDVDIVGCPLDEASLLDLLDTEPGALVLLDYEGMGPNAEALVARLLQRAPGCRVLVLASRSGEEAAVRVLRAGASGLASKDQGWNALLTALHCVAEGRLWAPPRAMARALSQLASGAHDEPHLSRREREVVGGVSRGLRNKEIAADLGISERTVKTHLNNIFAKLGLHSRHALAIWSQSL